LNLKYSKAIDASGEFEVSGPIDYDAFAKADLPEDVLEMDVRVMSIDVTWSPDTTSSTAQAQTLDYVLTSSFGPLSSSNSFEDLDSFQTADDISLQTSGAAMADLRVHLEEYLLFMVAPKDLPKLGVRGTVSGGRASGELEAHLRVMVSWTSCESVPVAVFMAPDRCS